jgi:hypothetical protein
MLFHQLTQEHHEGHLWIDALCIQQANVAERNYQVATTGQNYASANEVLVWLPKGPRASQRDRMLSKVGLLGKEEPLLRPSSRNEYWARAWILQELVLADRVTLRHGPTVISEEKLDDQLFFDDIAFSRRLEDYAMISIVRLRHRVKHGHRIMSTLFDILTNKYRPMLCSDPRDRAHSTLSLVSPEEWERYPIQPDYARPPTELLIELTKRYGLQHDIRSGLEKYYETFAHQTKSLGEGIILFVAQKLETKNPERAARAAVERATTNHDDTLGPQHLSDR